MSGAILRYGWKLGKKLGEAERKMIEETDFSLDVFTSDKIYGVNCTVIRLLPSRLGLFQNEFSDKLEILKDPRSSRWGGGESYYDDTGLQAYCNSAVLKSLHEKREIIPVVQANARSKSTKVLLWKVQFEGVLVFDAGPAQTGPYTMKYLSGRKLAGVSKPVARSNDALETFAHLYFNR
jgi:hypothetical protein